MVMIDLNDGEDPEISQSWIIARHWQLFSLASEQSIQVSALEIAFCAIIAIVCRSEKSACNRVT